MIFVRKCKPGHCRGRVAGSTVILIGMLFLTTLTMPQPVSANDRSPPSDSVDQDISERMARPDKRRARERRGNHAKRSKHSPASADQAPVRLQLNGSFELDLGAGNVIRGDGNITIELNQTTLERLGAKSTGKLDDAATAAYDFLQVLKRLPEMVEQTAEILKLLSNPEIQNHLRQVEQVLRLLPSGIATPGTTR